VREMSPPVCWQRIRQAWVGVSMGRRVEALRVSEPAAELATEDFPNLTVTILTSPEKK
jgi:hypothetical protein